MTDDREAETQETRQTQETPQTHETPREHFEEGEEAPPPGVRSMAIVRWALLAAMAAVAALSLWSYLAPLLGGETTEVGPEYYCPMHPQITSSERGECPICHMTLEPIPEERAKPSASTAESTSETPPGTTPITLALDRIQAIGVRTAPVDRRGGGEPLRVTATVEAPDRAKAEVHFRAEGFVEAIHVKELGVEVKRGQLLASIYSPEIYQAQQELLAIGGWSGKKAGNEAVAPLEEAARRRLELLGFGRGAADRILASNKPVRAVGVSSPIGGYVVRKDIVLGSHVMPETILFEIADLSSVYIIASVYPDQLAHIAIGGRATFATPSLSGRSFEAEVDLVYPEVDLATRATRVRFQVANLDKVLRPGMFGTAALDGHTAEELTVPIDAVIDTGRSAYVFVALPGGVFEPRLIQLGAELDDRVAVRGPLVAGDEVVSGATFLLDAESRLQASLARSSDPGGAAPGSCEADFDRAAYPDKYAECKKCELHRGMGSMEQDCRKMIAQPWR